LKERLRSDSFILVAEIESEIIGIIGIRDLSHIFLLFVEEDHQRRGIACQLLTEALRRCKSDNQKLEKITVNSSPNAVAAYKRMGFIAASKEQMKKGIRFVPMVLDLVKEEPVNSRST
jgi:predicted GNAT family N-acyltransferase